MTSPDQQPRSTPSIPGLDTDRLDMLRDLDPGDTTYLDRAIGNFHAKALAASDTLREHRRAEDRSALRAVAHKLSGSASNLGVLAAAGSATAVEDQALEASLDRLDALLRDLEEGLATGRRLLGAYQATYAGSDGLSSGET